MGMSSRALAKRSAGAPLLYQAIAVASGGRVIPVPGGVLIRDGEDQRRHLQQRRTMRDNGDEGGGLFPDVEER